MALEKCKCYLSHNRLDGLCRRVFFLSSLVTIPFCRQSLSATCWSAFCRSRVVLKFLHSCNCFENVSNHLLWWLKRPVYVAVHDSLFSILFLKNLTHSRFMENVSSGKNRLHCKLSAVCNFRMLAARLLNFYDWKTFIVKRRFLLILNQHLLCHCLPLACLELY